MAASRLVIIPPAVLAMGLALLASAWWMSAPEDVPTASRTSSTVHAPAATAPELASGDGTSSSPQGAPLPAPMPAWVPLPQRPAAVAVHLTALLSAPGANLRSSVLTALSAQAEGGRLYARALARRCADLTALPPAGLATDVNDVRRQDAVARQTALAVGCSQFANSEWLALVNIDGNERASNDPLLALIQSDLDEADLMRAVMVRPDALLLEELGERLLLRRIGGTATLYFDGHRFEGESDRSLAQAALRLLPCNFGLVCDKHDPDVWLACLRGEGCQASRTEREGPAAAALAARLAAALRSHELQRFLPQPS